MEMRWYDHDGIKAFCEVDPELFIEKFKRVYSKCDKDPKKTNFNCLLNVALSESITQVHPNCNTDYHPEVFELKGYNHKEN